MRSDASNNLQKEINQKERKCFFFLVFLEHFLIVILGPAWVLHPCVDFLPFQLVFPNCGTIHFVTHTRCCAICSSFHHSPAITIPSIGWFFCQKVVKTDLAGASSNPSIVRLLKLLLLVRWEFWGFVHHFFHTHALAWPDLLWQLWPAGIWSCFWTGLCT